MVAYILMLGKVQNFSYSSYCRKIKGASQVVLRQLYGQTFDLVYIDGAHEARYVIEDAVLCFPLVQSGGFILFDDYDFSFKQKSSQNTAVAIDAFVSMFSDEVTVVERGRQVLLRKN